MAAPEVDICGRQIAEAFVIATMVVIRDEVIDLCFKSARQIVVFEKHAVLERLMPSFDLALCHRVIRRTANKIHSAFLTPVGEITRDVA